MWQITSGYSDNGTVWSAKSAAFQSTANLAVSFCADLAANFYKPRIVSEQIIRKVECLLMSTESYRQILSCRRYKLIIDVVMR